MRIAMMGGFPVYPFANELGIDKRAIQRVSTWNQMLAEALSSREDLDIHFITSTIAIKETTTVSRDGLTVTYMVMPRRLNALTLFYYARWQARRLLRSIDPDVVHGIGTEHIWPAVAVASGKPAVVTVHGVVSEIAKHQKPPLLSQRRYFSWLEPRVLVRVQHLISISPYVTEALAGYIDARIHAIENPINQVFFDRHGDPAAGSYAVFVGSIEYLKGFHVLVDAMVLLAGRGSTVPRVVVVGPLSESDYKREQMQRLEDAGLQGHVDFRGFMLPEELAAVYGGAAFLILPSLAETASMCTAEALSCGIPVVCSRVGGMARLVSDGENGFLFEAGNADECADAISRLQEDPPLRTAMGKRAARMAIARWKPEFIAEQTAKVYQEVSGS